MAGARSRRNDGPDKFRYWIAAPVVVVWMVSAFVSLYTGDVRVFIAATPLMGAIVGAAIGITITRKAETVKE